ncbi:hypothetical protein ZWY2020_006600 [Hordeum vulgare]|nr:hypothetical protein ZWY2020_006600 [Hordeum vulgare]
MSNSSGSFSSPHPPCPVHGPVPLLPRRSSALPPDRRLLSAPAAPPPSEPPSPSSLARAASSLPCLLLASPLSTRRPQLATVREVDGRQQRPGSRNEGPLSSDSNVYEDHGDPSEAKHCRCRLNQAKERGARGAKKVINSELSTLHRPLNALPQRVSLVYYFPQGHSEQVPVCILLPHQHSCSVHLV